MIRNRDTSPREVPDLRPLVQGRRPVRILFVCLGNICRSPAAQGVAQQIIDRRGLSDMFVLDSCGFYGGHAGDLPDRRMRVHAFQRGYHLDHRSRVIKESDFSRFDIIIGMDDRNISNLLSMAPTPEDEKKVFRMTDFATAFPSADCVPDPYYEGAEGFELVLDLLENACEVLIDNISKL